VPSGTFDPDHIHLQDVYVNRIIKGEKFEKRIEFKTVTQNTNDSNGK
jgi:hypothetical protein